MSKFKLAALALALVAGTAGAAVQGTLGATSTGSFVNTFGISDRQVQVLNLQDAMVTPATGKVTYFVGGTGVGVEDKFCVVDTAGGAVLLKFISSAGMKTAIGPHIRDAKTAAGVSLTNGYALAVGVGAGVQQWTSLNTAGFTVPAANVVKLATSCGAGNVNKQVTLGGVAALPGNTATFTDTVTVLATPI